MANSFSNNEQNDIRFNSNNTIISSNTVWTVDEGSGSIGKTIILNGYSNCHTDILSPLASSRVDYLKIVANIDSNNKTLSTDDSHYISVSCYIEYEQNDNNDHINNNMEIFYPKFIFEDTVSSGILDNSSVIELSGKIIKSINIIINNDSSDTIIIKDIQIYYILSYVDTDQLSNAFSNEEYVSDLVNSYLNGVSNGIYDVIIPLVNQLPDINSVPDGFICRVSSIT